MNRFTSRLLITQHPCLNLKLSKRNVSLRNARKTHVHLRSVTRNIDNALEHFDGLYSRVYGKLWPSMRLGLLSPRKYCAILNTYVDNYDVPEEAINLQNFYAKRLRILEKKAAEQKDDPSIEIQAASSQLEISEREEETESDQENDLVDMFREMSIDDEDRPFFNQASTNVSLNDYVPASELIFHESVPIEPVRYDGTIRDVDKYIQMIDHPFLTHQEHLKIYTFPRGNWSRFDKPSIVPKADLFSYYLLDGASVLPVLLLEPKLDDVCADYCAAPGGKSIALLMTLKPKFLLCNDSSQSRLKRLHTVMRQYLPDIEYVRSTLNFSGKDARKLVHQDAFDKILVDVPCSNDRNSVESVENNIFKRSRTEERLSLPSNQCDILKAALMSVKCGGDVVYSTCTLAPSENDNVVKRSILQLREEGFPATYAVMNLRETLRPFNRLFAISRKFTYGQQVIPNVCSNFGPMYISKIRRTS